MATSVDIVTAVSLLIFLPLDPPLGNDHREISWSFGLGGL